MKDYIVFAEYINYEQPQKTFWGITCQTDDINEAKSILEDCQQRNAHGVLLRSLLVKVIDGE